MNKMSNIKLQIKFEELQTEYNNLKQEYELLQKKYNFVCQYARDAESHIENKLKK